MLVGEFADVGQCFMASKGYTVLRQPRLETTAMEMQCLLGAAIPEGPVYVKLAVIDPTGKTVAITEKVVWLAPGYRVRHATAAEAAISESTTPRQWNTL